MGIQPTSNDRGVKETITFFTVKCPYIHPFFWGGATVHLQGTFAGVRVWQVNRLQEEHLTGKTMTSNLLQSGTSLQSYHKYLLCTDGDYTAALVQNTNWSQQINNTFTPLLPAD